MAVLPSAPKKEGLLAWRVLDLCYWVQSSEQLLARCCAEYSSAHLLCTPIVFIYNKVNIKCAIIYRRYGQSVHYLWMMYTLCTFHWIRLVKVCTERVMCFYQGTGAYFKDRKYRKLEKSTVFSAGFYSTLILLSSVRYPRGGVHTAQTP